MASLITRIRRFMASPQGRQARMHAERLARDPRTQARVRSMLHRFGGRRR